MRVFCVCVALFSLIHYCDGLLLRSDRGGACTDIVDHAAHWCVVIAVAAAHACLIYLMVRPLTCAR